MIKMIVKLLKSRQFWTIVALVIINGVSSVGDLLPSEVLPYTNGVLVLLALYFRVNPKQQF